MGKERAWPVTLKVDIEPEGLKRVVEEGRLMEFVGAFSTLAAEHIKSHIVEQLSEAGVGLTEVGKGISIVIGFDVDDPYATGPKPWPWPRRYYRVLGQSAIEILPSPGGWVAIDTVPLPERPVAEEWLRRVVREELDRIGKL